jgi:hypothetical protein
VFSLVLLLMRNTRKKKSNSMKSRVKPASNQCIAMVLGRGGVYNSRVLSGLTKTSHKSISCVFFALCGADVDTEIG